MNDTTAINSAINATPPEKLLGSKDLISALCSKKISIMNFIMTIFIVLCHWTYFYEYYSTVNTSSYLYKLLYNFMDIFGYIALSYFFLMTGFLLFLGINSVGTLNTKVKGRLRSLLVPFIVWNVLLLIYEVAFSLLKRKSLPNLSFLDIVLGFSFKPFAGPLWYVFAILLFLPLAYLINLIRNKKTTTLIVFILLCGISLTVALLLHDKNISSTLGIFFYKMLYYLPCYLLGVFFAMFYPTAFLNINLSKKVKCIITIIFFITLAYLIFFGQDIYVLHYFSRIIIAITFWFILPKFLYEKVRISFALKINFFIYAMHMTLVFFLNTLFTKLFNAPLTFVVAMIIHILLNIILYVICLCFAYICKKIFPKKIFAMLSGGRAN